MRAPLLAAVALLLLAPVAARAQAWDEDESADEPKSGRLSLAVWGGNAWATSGTGRSVPLLGGEAAWSFGDLDVGVAGYAYRNLRGENTGSTPVYLARVTQRFETYRGVDAGVTLGIGAAHRGASWVSWFQFGLGMRVELGPMFLAGEVAFEQYDLLHLAGGIGVRFF